MLDTEKVRRIFQRTDLNQLLVCEPMAIYYLIHKKYEPGERFLGVLLRRNREAVLYVNSLFRSEEDLGIRKQYYTDTQDIVGILAQEVDSSEVLGVDKCLTARFLLPMMERKIASAFADGSLPVDLTRAVKDEKEIALMRKSSEINDAAMKQFKGLIHEGVTEVEVASEMLDIYKSLGAEGYSFPPIVAFGDNAADPHHEPDNTVIKEGDIVLFDVGCTYHGYCSDMTRTFFYKNYPDAEAERVYNLVRKANEEATKLCRPGTVISSVDRKAREIITEGGYGEDFTHRLGHFIGLTDHEYGDVSESNDRKEEVGNIHSIEPGIYHPGIAGVRIEDLVLITGDGHEVLNHYPHEIEVIE